MADMRRALLLLAMIATPAGAHEWAGLGDSRFGAVEAVVPSDWRDCDRTGAGAPTIGEAIRDSDDFAAGLSREQGARRRLSAARVADVLGVQDFEQNRRRWTSALAATALGAGGLGIAGLSSVGLAPFTSGHTAGVSALVAF